MKTPKRNKASHARCQFCKCVASLDDQDNENGWFACPYCGKMSKITEEFVSGPVCARWKRKNREAKLRHALRKKDEIIDYAASEVQRMENEACEEHEHQFRLRLSLAATRTLNNFQRGCINASGAFGQDIEGS